MPVFKQSNTTSEAVGLCDPSESCGLPVLRQTNTASQACGHCDPEEKNLSPVLSHELKPGESNLLSCATDNSKKVNALCYDLSENLPELESCKVISVKKDDLSMNRSVDL